MCGRFKLTVSAGRLARLFELNEPTGLVPRFNIAPSQLLLVVRRGHDGAPSWARARWGLIPSWAKDPSIGSRMINARAETVADKPSFRTALDRRRCLIPADGFYEWRREGSRKQPHLIRFVDQRPFAFAGLWERWLDASATAVDSCTILTTGPNRTVAPLHDRMPVILSPASFSEWLGPGSLPHERLAALLSPHPASEMEAFPVHPSVGNPKHDDPTCAEPYPA